MTRRQQRTLECLLARDEMGELWSGRRISDLDLCLESQTWRPKHVHRQIECELAPGERRRFPPTPPQSRHE